MRLIISPGLLREATMLVGNDNNDDQDNDDCDATTSASKDFERFGTNPGYNRRTKYESDNETIEQPFELIHQAGVK